VTAVPAAQQKVGAAQAQRAAGAAPRPSAEEESQPWEQLEAAHDTEELAARADTPPQKSRKSASTAARRPSRAVPLLTVPHDRKRLIIAATVTGVVLGGVVLVAICAWALSGSNKAVPALPTERAARLPLRVGEGQKYTKVTQAIRDAIPGDHIIVQGPVHEEELVFNDAAHARKNLTIESEGQPVTWRTPKGVKESPLLIALLDVEGLKLRGFTFDGDNRCKSLIRLGGKCPGTTLEDVTLQGFSGNGLVVMNCEGEEGRPVTITNLKVAVAADKTANAAIEFALSPREKDSNRFLHFKEVHWEGNYTTPILNREQTRADVTGLPQ
jgi:hypothetical protein